MKSAQAVEDKGCSAFADYINNIVTELSGFETGKGIDVLACIGNLNKLAHLAATSPGNELHHTKRLLALDAGLYNDLVRPALTKRLTIGQRK